MSEEFTQEDAEAAGWQIVHAADATLQDLGDGLQRVTNAVYRAEKYVRTKLVTQVSHSFEGLLDAIKDYEQHLLGRDPQSAGAGTPVEPGVKFSDLNPPIVVPTTGEAVTASPEPEAVESVEEPAEEDVEGEQEEDVSAEDEPVSAEPAEEPAADGAESA